MALSPRSSTRSTRTARPPSARRRSPGRMPMTTLRALRRLERHRQRRAGDADGVPFPLAGEQVHRRRADEAGDVDRHRPGEDLARRADLDDAAVHEDGDAVGERHRLFLVVGDVDGGDAERALQLAQLEAGLEAQLGVEVGERLVEQEQARLANDRARQRDALLLAAGELARRSLQQVADADLGGRPGDGAADLVARDADHLQREADVLLDRHVRIERVALEHHRDVALAGLLRRHVDAVHQHAARVHRFEAGEDAQRRRLARSRRAEQDEELARLDREVDAVQHRRLAVLLDDALDADGAGVDRHDRRDLGRSSALICGLRPSPRRRSGP